MFGTVRSIAKAVPISGVGLVEMDVRDDASVQAGIRSVIERTGRIDVLVNNAGTSLIGAVEETSAAEALSLFDTNVFSVLRTTQAVLPHMRAQRGGRIINVSSVLGFLPAPYMGLYSASKHAQLAFSRATAAQLRARRIRVHTIKPGFVETEGFPQARLPAPVQRLVVGPEAVAAHVMASLDHGRGESSVPRYYGLGGRLQAFIPNTFARVLGILRSGA